MSDMDDVLADLRRRRDELRLQIHLASKEVQGEWDELEGKMSQFAERARIRDTRSEVGKSLGQLGRELKVGYQRIREALKD